MKYINIVTYIMIFALNLFANNNTSLIKGKVIDKITRQPLTGVNIVILKTPQGTSTDENGNFILKTQPGSYNLGFYYMGYKSLLKSNIIVNPKKNSTLLLEMEQDLLQGETVEVSASYFEKPKEAVVSTRSIDFEEIRRDPGSSMDIQRVVQALPAVVSGTDQNNEIIVRGGMPGENLFLMDNIEIPNPNHFGDQGAGGGPINMLNTFMIRKVDFYAGAFSAKYGDKASSVMDISLREGNKEAFKSEFEMGMAGAGVLLEGPLPNIDGSYIISGRKSFLDLIISSTGLTAVPKYYNLQGKLNINLNSKNWLILEGLYGADEINIEEEGEGGYSRGAENVDYSGNQVVGGIILKTFWTSKLYSNTVLSSVKSNWDVDVYRLPKKENYFENDSKEIEYTIKSDFVYQLRKDIEFNWGASYKKINFDHQIWAEPDTIFIYNNVQPEPIGVHSIIPRWSDFKNADSYKTALYFQLSKDFFRKLRFTSGLRYDYFDYNSFSSISPRLGFSWLLNHKTTINLAYGKQYQSPAYIALTAHPENRNLGSKYTQQYILSFEKLFREDIKMTIETYYKTYHDIPVNISYTVADTFFIGEGKIINKGLGYAGGIELFLQKKLTDKFSAIISYSHSVARAKDLRIGEYYDWDYDFRDVLTLIGGYKNKLHLKSWYKNLKEKWWYKATAWILPLADEVEFSFRFRYLGGRPYSPPQYLERYHRWRVLGGQKYNTERYPVYNRFDIRLDRRYFFKHFNMVTYFDIMNVYHRKNIWEYSYNDDGSIEKVEQFSVFPVGGIVLEF